MVLAKKPSNEKAGNSLGFYQTEGGGGTPKPNYIRFFLGDFFYYFKMIYMLWNMKQNNIMFTPIMIPPPHTSLNFQGDFTDANTMQKSI